MKLRSNKLYRLYYVIACFAIAITTIGATYAYYAGTTQSSNNSVKTGSTTYRVSLDITSVYSDFSIIPMNDSDALKAIKNECKDKYDRGACSAYTLRVYDFDETLQYISGKMDIVTDNMENLSYMVLEEKAEYDEDSCVTIANINYCTSVEATHMGEGTNLSLGSSYDVEGLSEKNLLLVIWLTNLNQNQNLTDIGNFNAIVTVSAGDGGEIKGTISSAIQIYGGSEPEPDPENNNP